MGLGITRMGLGNVGMGFSTGTWLCLCFILMDDAAVEHLKFLVEHRAARVRGAFGQAGGTILEIPDMHHSYKKNTHINISANRDISVGAANLLIGIPWSHLYLSSCTISFQTSANPRSPGSEPQRQE